MRNDKFRVLEDSRGVKALIPVRTQISLKGSWLRIECRGRLAGLPVLIMMRYSTSASWSVPGALFQHACVLRGLYWSNITYTGPQSLACSLNARAASIGFSNQWLGILLELYAQGVLVEVFVSEGLNWVVIGFGIHSFYSSLTWHWSTIQETWVELCHQEFLLEIYVLDRALWLERLKPFSHNDISRRWCLVWLVQLLLIKEALLSLFLALSLAVSACLSGLGCRKMQGCVYKIAVVNVILI